MKQKMSPEALEALIRRLCAAEPYAGAFRLTPKDFAPFLRAGAVFLWESAPLLPEEVPVWLERTLDQLGREADHCLLYCWVSSRAQGLAALNRLQEADVGPCPFSIGLGVREDCGEGQAVLLLLAAVACHYITHEEGFFCTTS